MTSTSTLRTALLIIVLANAALFGTQAAHADRASFAITANNPWD